MLEQNFSFYNILWYILIYSLIGWVIEVIFCSANTGHFVNRGFLNGPVCPIYGFGGTLVIALLAPIQSIILLFIGSVLVTSALELATGYLLDKAFHTRWWDYTKQPFNIGGYVCLKFSLAWGVACVFLVRLLHPAIAGLVSLLPMVLGVVLLCVFYAFFIADIIVTVNIILKLNKDLGEIAKIAEGLHRQSESLAENIGTRAVTTYEKLEELDVPELLEDARDKMESQKQKVEDRLLEQMAKLETAPSLKERLEEGKEQLEVQKEGWAESLEAQKQRLQSLLQEPHPFRRRLLRAFPNMQNRLHADALRQLREKYEGAKEKGSKTSKK